MTLSGRHSVKLGLRGASPDMRWTEESHCEVAVAPDQQWPSYWAIEGKRYMGPASPGARAKGAGHRDAVKGAALAHLNIDRARIACHLDRIGHDLLDRLPALRVTIEHDRGDRRPRAGRVRPGASAQPRWRLLVGGLHADADSTSVEQNVLDAHQGKSTACPLVLVGFSRQPQAKPEDASLGVPVADVGDDGPGRMRSVVAVQEGRGAVTSDTQRGGAQGRCELRRPVQGNVVDGPQREKLAPGRRGDAVGAVCVGHQACYRGALPCRKGRVQLVESSDMRDPEQLVAAFIRHEVLGSSGTP